MNAIDEFAWRRRAAALPHPLKELGAKLGWPNLPPITNARHLPLWKRAAGTWAEAIRRAVLALHDGRTVNAGEWLEFAARIERDWYDGRDGMTRDAGAALARLTGIVLVSASRPYVPVAEKAGP